MSSKFYFIGILTLILASNIFGQLTLPRDSQRAEVSQTVGDTKVSLVYHRPNIKGRKVWGTAPPAADAKGTATLDTNTRTKDEALVNYGHVWRIGANENTTFEVTNDVKINGQMLPAGKYGLHAIPNQNEWTIIFNKVNDSWGSFTYDEKKDQLRVTTKPQTTADFEESLSLGLENIKANTADVVIHWANVRVPFTIDVGDVNARVLTYIRNQMSALKPTDARSPMDGANYVYAQKMTASYPEAIGWVDAALKVKETGGALALKANLLAETGKKSEAITTGERAVTVAKAANPKADTSQLEKRIADWKAGK